MLTRQQVALSAEERELVLEQLRDALLTVDSDITDIMVIGSSVYSPDLAVDIDLLVRTRQKKDEKLYWDAVWEAPCWVDVIVQGPGDPWGWDFTWGVRAFHRVLYGGDEWIEEMVKDMQPLSWDWARAFSQIAQRNFDEGVRETNPLVQDGFYREAFNALFEVTRRAAMVFLNTQEGRWGRLKNMLPPPFDHQFDRIIRTVHIAYWYDGNYPRDRVSDEFAYWKQVVEQFVNDLEQASTPP